MKSTTDTITIKVPFLMAVDDYHEFNVIFRSFVKAGIKETLKYEEIGFVDGKYYAVFFVGKMEGKALKLYREIESRMEKYNE